MPEILTDFERGVVAGKIAASQAFVRELDALAETLTLSSRLRDARLRFVESARSFRRMLDVDDMERMKAGLPPYATALQPDPTPLDA